METQKTNQESLLDKINNVVDHVDKTFHLSLSQEQKLELVVKVSAIFNDLVLKNQGETH
jgi:transcriptional regulatory protein LevR